ncbi:MAG TPA: hypothetical protein VKB80_05230 [Kofleriaceae bacterium]|nr:hypothetical protein [Kofleriaceae bacterium]
MRFRARCTFATVTEMPESARARASVSLRALLLAFALAASAPFMFACGGGGSSDGSCPNDLPDQSECEGDVTNYQDDAAAIIDARCVACHGPGGPEASRDLSTYAGVHGQADAVLRQIYSCRMPPSGVDPLDPEERATLLLWLVCGAKEN